MNQAKEYDGAFYRAIGDFVGAKYLDWGFTRGTKGEVDFLVEFLPAGSRVLDVGCGVGRHSLELARRRFHVVGVDISQGLIDVAREAAAKEKLAVECYCGDARELSFDQQFDAAICLCEGAFGLAGSDEGHQRVLAGVYRALRPGAIFILTAINAFAVVRQGPADFDAYTATSVFRETIRNARGEQREVDIFTTAFTYRELRLIIERAGFDVVEAFGCEAGRFERKPLTIQDTEIMMISRRR